MAIENDDGTKTGTSAATRQGLRAVAVNRMKEAKRKLNGISVESKQQPEEGIFTTDILRSQKLLKPPFDPLKLLDIVESSSILPQCIDAMECNVDGFGYELLYQGLSEQVDSTEMIKEKTDLSAFFDKVNEGQSFTALRKDLRHDLEATGNSYIELLRFEDNSPAMLYYVDAKYVRLQSLQDTYVEVTIPIFRNGSEQEIKVKKRFRKYAMITKTAAGTSKITWFKQFGDPREMDVHGIYEDEEKFDPDNLASEIIHLKIGPDTYGVPRWVGNILNAMGMHASDYVNWDLFENQVVPPLVIMVSGGVLSSESVEDIKQILLQKKGVENFNKTLILEAQGEGGTNERNAVKIELKELSAARKEDAMFTQYVERGERRIRGAFRLPPLYLGQAETYSKSTADSSKLVAEEQVFVPIRNEFDEFVNLALMPLLGAKNYKFKTKGPRLITGQDIITGFDTFARNGVISMNEGVKIANNILGLDLTTYTQSWGDYPIPVVTALAGLGTLGDIEEIMAAATDLASTLEDASIDDPEQAAKAYVVMTQLRSMLSKFAGKKLDEENEQAYLSRGGR